MVPFRKVPVPLEIQEMELAPVAFAPVIKIELLQVVASGPAKAVATGTTVKVRLSLTEVRQGAIGVPVRVSTTLPLVASATLGVYTGLVMLGLSNVPVPDVVHVNKDIFEAVAPTTANVPLEQMDPLPPAFTTGTGYKLMRITSDELMAHGAIA